MRIGIDIDNVISNFNEILLKEFIAHDIELGGWTSVFSIFTIIAMYLFGIFYLSRNISKHR